MMRFLLCLLLILNCKAPEKKEWQNPIPKKDFVRFQIQVFALDKIPREKRIFLTQKFAELWSKHSGYASIVLDEKSKADLLKSNQEIPSTNFSIQSKFNDSVLRLFVVDLETGEILSYGKLTFTTEEDFLLQMESVIVMQLLRK